MVEWMNPDLISTFTKFEGYAKDVLRDRSQFRLQILRWRDQRNVPAQE